jgi:hypothetical protein
MAFGHMFILKRVENPLPLLVGALYFCVFAPFVPFFPFFLLLKREMNL